MKNLDLKILSPSNVVMVAALALAMGFASPSMAEQKEQKEAVTIENVQASVSKTMDKVMAYGVDKRDEALAMAREGMSEIDAEIERLENKAAQNWQQLSEASREEYQAAIKELKQTREAMNQRYSELENGASDAWTDLKEGFGDAWQEFRQAWTDTEKATDKS